MGLILTIRGSTGFSIKTPLSGGFSVSSFPDNNYRIYGTQT